MQKKLLAVAVAGALGAPVLAHAQASTVQVFGTLYTEYAFMNQGRTTAAGPDRVNVDMLQTPGSEIGFKGEEQLGGGMSAWFQCASTADTRGADYAQGFCSRNSAVGMKGAFGNLFIGNWDTPWKRVFGVNRIVNETGAWGDSFLLAGGSTTVNTNTNPGEWVRRQENSINYDSPSFGGFQLMLSTTASTPATSNLSNNTVAKPRLWSLGGTYNNGPLNIGLAYEQHKDFNPSGAAVTNGLASGTDKGWIITGGYKYGPVNVGAMYIQRKFDTVNGLSAVGAGGTRSDLKVSSWQVAVDWTIAGPHGLRAAYTRADDTKGSYVGTIDGSSSRLIGNNGAGSTGAKLWQINYVHTFSKRTEGTLGYSKLNNDSNAVYALGGLSRPLAGESQHAWGGSIRHRF